MREPTSSADGQVQVRMPPDLRRAIEDFRRQQPDIPTRPEAIRRLLKQAVMARQDNLLAATAKMPASEITELDSRNACVPEKEIAAA